MRVVLYGASGMIGSRILKELGHRGHSILAVTRHPEKVAILPGVRAVKGDVTDRKSVTGTAKGYHAAISAYSPPRPNPTLLVSAAEALVAGLARADVSRLIVVGSAGTLEVSPGLQQLETPEFPDSWLGIALAHRDSLAIYKKSDLDWTYFSPSAWIEPGPRTGKFRIGVTQLLSDDNAESRITVEDYALALVNELEKPQHVRQQFTVGY